MKKPQTDAAAGVSENKSNPNLGERPDNCKSDGLIRRDARAMVHILNQLRGNSLTPFENVYESLKGLHGPQFEKYFRDQLSNTGGRNG